MGPRHLDTDDGHPNRPNHPKTIEEVSRSRHIVLMGTAIGCLLLPVALRPLPRLVWNASSSAPIGLYSVTPGASLNLGDMVVARLPHPYRSLAARRRYLPANVPLVKRLVAQSGDRICAQGRAISVNGRHVANRLSTDAKGRRMPVWSGCITLGQQELFLLMDNQASFDGRYFGPSDKRDLVGKAQLLWRP